LTIKCAQTTSIINKTIYITQLIYFKKGQEKVFKQFENIAIPTIAKYKGRLLLRVIPPDDNLIEYNAEKPIKYTLLSLTANMILKISNPTRNNKNSYT
jgi:hypothetical protein